MNRPVQHSGGERRCLVLILGAHLALSLGFALATPVLEASDEARHFGYVIDWRESGALPVARAEAPGYAHQEALQPPLYYALARLITLDVQFDDAPVHYRWQSGSPVGRADLPGPRNMFQPVPPRGSPPGTGDAVMRIRYLSIFLSTLTVIGTWQCARAAGAGPATRLFAASLVAFNPMFLFIGSSVNNDALVAPLATLGLLVCLRSLDGPLTVRRAAALGALAGLSTMAKLSGLILVPTVALLVLLRSPGRRALLRRGVAAGGAFSAIAGWWFARQHTVYGVLGSTAGMDEMLGNGRGGFDPTALLREWEGFFKSFWGVFGAFNIIYPEWVYRLLLVATLALGAAAVALLLRVRSAHVRLMFGMTVTNLVAVGWWTAHVMGSQGRLMFPSIAAIATLSALGLAQAPSRIARPVGALIVGGLALAATYAAFVLIPLSYLWG